LRLNSTNLEAEWSSFEKKFNWFLVAIGADKKNLMALSWRCF